MQKLCNRERYCLFKSSYIRSRTLFSFALPVCFSMTLCFMLFNLSTAQAQSPENGEAAEGQTEIKPLLVGQKVPEEFWTREHLFYVDGDTVRKTLEEYRGKLLIVDFWATWCAICWYQMKDNHHLSDRYNGKIDFLLVSPQSTKDNFEKISTTHHTRLRNLGLKSLSSVFADNYISNLFLFKGYPAYMWISPSGHFIAHTGRQSVTDGHIEGVLSSYKSGNE
ncbi:redoxin domain-containing protein [Sphingobacterium phlebotomi]|uniref:Redoxin domain-containing protein n=2 Tax=Sphingobacterium phlebotomi TaxID=2605433 RepID=A0A5D4H8M4_9SPHI|nr:redoxin domain-containing protein [Sphingobacterium phlebotomi]